MSNEGLGPSAVTKLSWDDGVIVDPAIKYGERFPRTPVKPSWIKTKKMRGNVRPMLNTRNADLPPASRTI
jgi:hypothetical protein